MRSTEAAFGRLVSVLPALRAILDEHLENQEGELLEYIFIADVERWAEATIHSDRGLVESQTNSDDPASVAPPRLG
jgi:hypothetical protein